MSTNALGAAVLTDAEFPAGATGIVFAAGTVEVGTIELTDKSVVFEGAAGGTTLRGNGKDSAFRLRGATGDWTFANLALAGVEPSDENEPGPADGGAIDCEGGRLCATNCAFTGFQSHFSGGAVSARMMGGDVVFTGCAFVGNVSGAVNGLGNGTGGALYLTARAGASGTARLTDCGFSGNVAENGGAVMTLPTHAGQADPFALAVEGCVFADNEAFFNGGAIAAEGGTTVTNTLFEANVAGQQGGAVCFGLMGSASAADLVLRSGTVFRGNRIGDADMMFEARGGAVAVMTAGYRLVASDRHVIFDRNAVRSRVGSYGGAVYLAEGAKADLAFAGFLGNSAEDAGGALLARSGAEVTVSTCAFSNNTVSVDWEGVGAAIATDDVTLDLRNCTVRGSNRTAVDLLGATATIVNCVVVGNGGTDLQFVDSSVSVSRSAYGTLVNLDDVGADVPLTADVGNLTNRTAAIYAGDTLALDSAGFNPVASLGLAQDAADYDGVRYGSRPAGFSMGAFECGTEGLYAVYSGSRAYDGTSAAPSNMDWTVVDGDGQPVTLAGVDMTNVFEVTSCTLGSADVGTYCSTNAEEATKVVFTHTVKDPAWAQAITPMAAAVVSPCAAKLTSGTQEFIYNGQAHSNVTVTAEGFVSGEGVAPYDFATITLIGTNDNTFAYAAADGTDLANYEISVVKGSISVVKGRIQQILEETFGPDAFVEPVADDNGEITNHVVSVTNNITGPVVIPLDVEALIIDLGGHSITGTVGETGTTSIPGGIGEPAIVVSNADVQVTVTGPGEIIGGRGGDGFPGGDGAEAIVNADGEKVVPVAVTDEAKVEKGARGADLALKAEELKFTDITNCTTQVEVELKMTFKNDDAVTAENFASWLTNSLQVRTSVELEKVDAAPAYAQTENIVSQDYQNRKVRLLLAKTFSGTSNGFYRAVADGIRSSNRVGYVTADLAHLDSKLFALNLTECGKPNEPVRIDRLLSISAISSVAALNNEMDQIWRYDADANDWVKYGYQKPARVGTPAWRRYLPDTNKFQDLTVEDVVIPGEGFLYKRGCKETVTLTLFGEVRDFASAKPYSIANGATHAIGYPQPVAIKIKDIFDLADFSPTLKTSAALNNSMDQIWRYDAVGNDWVKYGYQKSARVGAAAWRRYLPDENKFQDLTDADVVIPGDGLLYKHGSGQDGETLTFTWKNPAGKTE